MTKAELADLRETWSQRVAAYRSSGQTGAAWCTDHGLKEHQLWYWVKRLRATAPESTSAQFIPVQVGEQEQADAMPLVVRVGAAAIEVRHGYDAQLLVHLVQTLAVIC